MVERLQKIIARAGVSSRRAGEELILAGRVRVNGHVVTELGAKADPRSDTIEVDGKRLVSEPFRYIVLHKPRNVVSTLHDPEGRATVAELLKGAGSRLYPVGRLDFATSGVLLMTNDGDFTNGLLHPRGGVPKTYVLKVKGMMGDHDLERWAAGVELDDGKTLPAEIHGVRHDDDKTWFEITIREGRNQQIRRMGEATGFPVMRLARLSFAGITSEGLRPGDFRSLTVDELEDLRKHYGVPKRIRGAVLGERNEAPAKRPRRASDEGARPPRAREGAAGPARRAERTTRSRDEAPPRRGPRDARPSRSQGTAPDRSARGERPARPREEGQRGARDARPSRSPDRPAAPAKRADRPATRPDRPTKRADRPATRPARPARPRDAGARDTGARGAKPRDAGARSEKAPRGRSRG